MKTRLRAALTALVLVLGLLPGTALAAEPLPAERNEALEALDAALAESVPEEAEGPADPDALEAALDAALDADGTGYYAFEEPGSQAPRLSSGARAADGSVTYSGSGAKTITGVSLPEGAYFAEYRYTGSGNFISKLYYGSRSYDYFSISNEIGSCHGIAPMYGNDNLAVSGGRLEVSRGSGSWTITFRPVTGTATTNLKGSGDTVTGFFTARRTSYTISGTHSSAQSGARNFIVRIVRERDSGASYRNGIGVFNEIGTYSGSKTVTLEAGVRYYVYVNANGPWTLDFGQGDGVTDYTGWLSSSGGSGGGGTSGGSAATGKTARDLANYILSYGTAGTNSATGAYYRVIQTTDILSSGSAVRTSIRYTPSTNTLNFRIILASGSSGYGSAADFDMNASTQAVTRMPTGYFMSGSSVLYAAEAANFSISAYNGDQTPLTFRILSGAAYAPSNYADLFNAAVQALVPGAGVLSLRAGVTLADLGFASYSGSGGSGGSGGGNTPSGGGVREFIQYIKTHGEYKTGGSSGGSPYYAWQEWEGPMGARTLWGFQYTPSEDILGFSMTEMNTRVPGGSPDARNDITTVSVIMDAASQTCPKGTILVTRMDENDAGSYVTAWYEAPFSFASYNGDKTPLSFRITQAGAETPIPFNDYCNRYVQAAAALWETKVKAAGFTMREVGFASYGNPGPWEVRAYSGGRVEFYGPLESGASLWAAHYGGNGRMTQAARGSASGNTVTFSGLTLAPGDRIFVVNPGTLSPVRSPVALR